MITFVLLFQQEAGIFRASRIRRVGLLGQEHSIRIGSEDQEQPKGSSSEDLLAGVVRNGRQSGLHRQNQQRYKDRCV